MLVEMEVGYVDIYESSEIKTQEVGWENEQGDKTTHVGFPFEKIAQWQVHFSTHEAKRKRSRCTGKEDHFDISNL